MPSRKIDNISKAKCDDNPCRPSLKRPKFDDDKKNGTGEVAVPQDEKMSLIQANGDIVEGCESHCIDGPDTHDHKSEEDGGTIFHKSSSKKGPEGTYKAATGTATPAINTNINHEVKKRLQSQRKKPMKQLPWRIASCGGYEIASSCDIGTCDSVLEHGVTLNCQCSPRPHRNYILLDCMLKALLHKESSTGKLQIWQELNTYGGTMKRNRWYVMATHRFNCITSSELHLNVNIRPATFSEKFASFLELPPPWAWTISSEILNHTNFGLAYSSLYARMKEEKEKAKQAKVRGKEKGERKGKEMELKMEEEQAKENTEENKVTAENTADTSNNNATNGNDRKVNIGINISSSAALALPLAELPAPWSVAR